MILEDAPGSVEFTVTDLQGKSHTFLGQKHKIQVLVCLLQIPGCYHDKLILL